MTTGTPVDSPLGEPRRFGPYLLLEELGRGAQGIVFLAEHSEFQRKVALKVLTGAGAQSQAVRDRFRREAQITSKLEHPGICGVRDVGEVDGLPYIAMQYVRGTTLASLVEKARDESSLEGGSRGKGSETITIAGGKKGGLEDVLRLVESAARALHVAHEAGLVHRDIKPANIMVTGEGQPVLLDFGLARDLESEGQALTQSGQILGTPAYMAPEQIVATRGVVDRRSDVYALGVTLFECLTLRRPFVTASFDALFNEILNGAPRSPRSVNPRIPVDLATVIEVAMDRDQNRRYATAEALAEDLRRVRSFEPIQAKAVGRITRIRKWARRNPGPAVSSAAGAVFVLFALGFVVARAVQRRADLREHLKSAAEGLASADYIGATVAVAKALELDPESAEVLELKSRVERSQLEAEREAERKKALTSAAAARVEASDLRTKYARARTEIDELGAELLKSESTVLARYADEETRIDFAKRETELYTRKLEAERMLLARSQALERALRLEAPWGGASVETNSALAAFYMERWREALRSRDAVRAAAMSTAVELYDVTGEHRGELLGRGSMSLSVVPEQAECYLFRFEGHESLRPGRVIPRLVPVPTKGIGHAREPAWPADFEPGDPSLVVETVEPGSVAEQHGITAGDLVLRFQGVPAAESLLLREVRPESCLALHGVEPLSRITAVNDTAISSRFEWFVHSPMKDGVPPRVTFEGHARTVECDPREISVGSPLDLIHAGVATPTRIDCLRRGELVTIEVPAGVRSGLTCEPTAYPLVFADRQRIAAKQEHAMDPGSYLLFVRHEGFEPQRFLFVVERRKTASVHVELLREGSVPEGFVHIPAGPFFSGGDPQAFRPREGRTVELPSYFVARKELTNREWYEFVNDPVTLERIAATPPGEHLYLPQDDRVMARKDANAGYTWDVYTRTSAESPVLGLCWTDVRDYLAWRNARAEASGEPWRYDLPSEAEWEKAARGVDGRAFPWGDRFDPSLTVCLVRQDGFLLDAPGGFEPRDESPFGVLDMAGSREEWLRDLVENSDPPVFRKHGGHWGTSVGAVFRTTSRGEASQDRFASSQGVRLVARSP